MEDRRHQVIDTVDRDLVREVQLDGRASVAHLARRIHRSATATSERLKRLVEDRVITAFTAEVDHEALGYPLLAFIRLHMSYRESTGLFLKAIGGIPEVVECHHTTGDDCYLIRVVARDMNHLEEITMTISRYGDTTSSLVYSTPIPRRPIGSSR